jgi:hypothetical protein
MDARDRFLCEPSMEKRIKKNSHEFQEKFVAFGMATNSGAACHFIPGWDNIV